jgi:hypothetical protein
MGSIPSSRLFSFLIVFERYLQAVCHEYLSTHQTQVQGFVLFPESLPIDRKIAKARFSGSNLQYILRDYRGICAITVVQHIKSKLTNRQTDNGASRGASQPQSKVKVKPICTVSNTTTQIPRQRDWLELDPYTVVSFASIRMS